MERTFLLSAVVCLFISGVSFADTFAGGTANEFDIDFVPISGDSGNLGSWSAGYNYTFSGVSHEDYRMGTYEITNDQWNKFKNSLGVSVMGSPSSGYDEGPDFTGSNIPTNEVSWYEAAQFVNWLNTSKGYQPAYKFTGGQGTINYTFTVWEATDAGYDASNPFRNSNACYFLPTEDEWIKAAYWNGTSLQTHATKAGESLFQGDGTSGTGWNYYDGDYVFDPVRPWNVGSGSEELNGTFDMMGNVEEWMENPYYSGEYLSESLCSLRGGYYLHQDYALELSRRASTNQYAEAHSIGFRVASVIPEPVSLLLLGLGGLLIRRYKRL